MIVFEDVIDNLYQTLVSHTANTTTGFSPAILKLQGGR